MNAREIKAAKVIRKIVESNGKKVNVSKAMREEGYAPGYAKNPQNFTRTKAAQALLEKFFPDSKLHKKTEELQQASRPASMLFPASKIGKRLEHVPDKEIKQTMAAMGLKCVHIREQTFPPAKVAYYLAPERKIQLGANEMAYKLKGSFAPEKVDVRDVNPFEEMSDQELADAIKEAKDFLTKKK